MEFLIASLLIICAIALIATASHMRLVGSELHRIANILTVLLDMALKRQP